MKPSRLKFLRVPRALIRAPQAHERPAVVAAGHEHVDLVAAVRAVLALPDLTRAGMHGEPERRAVTEREDLGPVAVAADERIVARHAAVLVEPQDLARVRARVLRVAAGRRHVDLAVGPEDHARHGARVGLRDEQIAHVAQRFAVPAAARERERAFVVGEPLVVRQIDELVVGEARMQRDLEQTRSAAAA